MMETTSPVGSARLPEPVAVVDAAVARVDGDPTRLMDVAIEVQRRLGCVDDEATRLIAERLSLPPVQVEGLVTFYAFLSKEQKGRIVVRLCDDVVDRMSGFDQVLASFERELGVAVGETTEDGVVTLETTPCIGMCDQAPAALVGDVVVTNLRAEDVPDIVETLRRTGEPERLVKRLGDGLNAHALVGAMVENNIRHSENVLLSPELRTKALEKALSLSPAEVIRAIKAARLRGRGGAGFPTGMKWEFTRAAKGDRKFVICNADEGEPGTFKDRVLLTERPNRVLAGLTIAGYAVGASEGVIYLRGEYEYLRPYLEDVIQRRREDGLLGRGIGTALGSNRCFDFDVRIQMGAGAYICGEESALIESCEGHRGDPRNRPPFPAQRGYLGCPTSVNNVETLCCVTKILHEGAATFTSHGTIQSSGTKLLSISGDVARPGVYEVDFGISVKEVLGLAGADDAAAVLVGGPSGRFVGVDEFERTLCFDDLATGGAFVVFGHGRDMLEVASWYMDFFVEESCGYCVPCRAGNRLLAAGLDKVRSGRATPDDLVGLRALGEAVKRFSRCGLGQTSPNPVLTTMDSLASVYERAVTPDPSGVHRAFDLERELATHHALAGPGIHHIGNRNGAKS